MRTRKEGVVPVACGKLRVGKGGGVTTGAGYIRGFMRILKRSGTVRIGPVRVHMRGTTYHCRFWVNGHEFRQALRTDNPQIAVTAAERLALGVITGRIRDAVEGVAAHADGRRIPTVAELAASFYADRRARGLRPKSLAWLRWQEKIAKAAFGGRPVTSIRRPDIMAVIEARKGSRRGLAQYLRGIFRYAVEEGFIDRSPADAVHMRDPAAGRIPEPFCGEKHRAAYLTPEQVAKYQKAFAGTLLALPFLLGVFAGLRIAEILHLGWQSVDLAAGVIHVASTGEWQTKNGKARTILLQPQLRAALEAAPVKEGLVCRSPHGHAWTVMNLVRSETAICEKADLLVCPRHAWRHTFGVACAGAGIPLTTIQAWLGHRSITTTQVYAHYASGYQGQGIEKVTFAN